MFLSSLINIDFTLEKLVFVGLLVLMGIVLVLEIGKNKRLPLIGILLFLVGLGLFAINEIGALSSIRDMIAGLVPVSFELVLIAAGALFFLITLIIYCVNCSKINREALENEKATKEARYVPVNEKMVYFTAKLNGKVKKVSKDFYRVFHEVKKAKKNWHKHVQELTVNEVQVPANKLIKSLKNFEDEMNVTIVLDNGRRINIPLLRMEHEKHGKQIGYIYVNLNESYLANAKAIAWEAAKNKMFSYGCMLELPLAYYDATKNAYICTDRFRRLLEIENPELPYAEYASRILSDDLNVFKTKMYTNSVNRYYYRLRTNQGYLWFEEKTLVIDGHEYMVVQNREKNPEFDLDAKTYAEMVQDIDAAYEAGTPFAAAIISFNNIPVINEKLEADNTDMLVYKFFEKLGRTLNTNKIKIYHFGDIEYGILFDNFEEYNYILRSFANSTSPLMKADVFYNDTRYSLANKVGFVESKYMANVSPDAMIKAALDSLDVASDPEYKNDFCIYFPPKPRTQVFSLDDYDINLNDEYLDNIYKK